MALSLGGSGGSAAQAGIRENAKAFLMLDPGFLAAYPIGRKPNPTLVFRYNPTDMKISGGTKEKKVERGAADDKGETQVALGRKNRSLSFTLFVDQFELPSGDVMKELGALHDWTLPRSNAAKQVAVPWLRFQWGSKKFFRCHLQSYDITYTMFARTGAPLRASASVKLEEVEDTQPGTNPTSGGEGGERVHTVTLGDSLHSIAMRHYGRAAAWRALGTFNGIDDPQRLPTGSLVQLPSLTDLEALL